MFKQIFNLFKSDSLYVQALEECHEMLDIDLAMFKESINSLRKSDSAEISIDIFAMDKKINEFERDVRRKVMTHLAIGRKEDIGSGLTLVSVVIDIERIGDYTKNIYDLAVNQGGNSAFSEADKVSIVNGVKVMGAKNILNKLALTASNLYAKNLSSFVNNLYNKEKKDVYINQQDEIISKTLINKEL